MIAIGGLEILRLEESCGPAFEAAHFLPDWDPRVLADLPWMAPGHFHVKSNRLVASLHSWVIRTRHHTILIDTCAGNHKERPHSPMFHRKNTDYLERMKAAGVDREKVDFVLCTHLHVDHVGWNTMLEDGRWVPTFPNARYVFSQTDRDYWDPAKNPDLDEQARQIFTDSVHPVIAAGLDRLVSMQDALDDNLLIEPAPGHTPGHVVFRLKDSGAQGLFTGDVMHHPVQVYRPHWSSRYCFDPKQSAETRRHILGDCVDCGALMLPAHFGAPHAGRIRAKGEGFSIDWVE